MNPFKISGPAQIGFSGGRTSGMMLYRIIEAHDGQLPPDVIVTFANTGKEQPETLDFVRECGVRFGVRIHWLEYRPEKPFFAEVSFETAAKLGTESDGAPFKAMIKKEGYMPNPSKRLCTKNLKIKTQARFTKSMGLRDWTAVIGFRADEGERVAKNRERGESRGYRCIDTVFPLAAAGVTETDVMAFWKSMPFDLALAPGDGNCDLCFLKGTEQRVWQIRKRPGSETWWSNEEKESGMQFRANGYSYEQLGEIARNQVCLPIHNADALGDCTCHD